MSGLVESGGGPLEVVKRGWRTSPELRDGIALTVVLAILGGTGRVVVPILVQQILDRGIADGDVRMSTVVSVAIVGLIAVAGTAAAARATRARLATSGERALATLRIKAFRHIHRLSIATQSEERRGALVARVTSDVETLSQFLSWGGISWLVNGAVMLAVIVVMAIYDWRLCLIAVSVVIPMTFVLRLVQRLLGRAWGQVRERNAEMLTAISETVMGAAVVRAYDAEPVLQRRSRASIEAHRKANVRAGTIGALLFPSGEIFSVLTIAAVMDAGVALGPAGGLTAGQVVAFIFLVSLFLEPVAEFTEIMDQTQMAVAGWRRVLDIIETPVDLPEPLSGVQLPSGPPEVTVDDVSFSYGGDGPMVLKHVSCVIPAGSRVALVGATGSGKTTLAKLLARLADPTDGAVRVAGVDLREVASESLRSTVVMVPQEGFLFDTTIADNVRFGHGDATDEDVARAFADLGLASWLDTLPSGLETRVGERGEYLSVGERQLVSLARAYLTKPSCLILDEATSAVDPATEVRLSAAVENLTEGRTTIAIAHRLSTAERADSVLVMDHGRLVEQGTHTELLARGGVYARLHERWLAGTSVTA